MYQIRVLVRSKSSTQGSQITLEAQLSLWSVLWSLRKWIQSIIRWRTRSSTRRLQSLGKCWASSRNGQAIQGWV